MKIKKLQIYSPVIEVEFNKLFGRLYLIFNYWRTIKFVNCKVCGFKEQQFCLLVIPRFRRIK